MTREEAIRWLIKPVITSTEVSATKAKELEAYDMAIEALSAEESVTLYATPKATYIRPLTEEMAIEFLQDSGWLPNHDKEIGNPPMLVRCKDCRYWEYVQDDGDCIRHTDDTLGYAISTNADDFCSYGERREP